ncbi:hypothetical protein JIX56_47490 [Streptomyces sp. CA-210063]|uniref:hypothetical protein n=1 Tax=Streptomyces sp. CA-210063 TaxID=2801029 RepID=UPI00214B426E|nr:hypothetical protein [Streptomyces sp. CA-210063]UUU36826.1 hypothetical protein JIX56_47490 [Streptomyces sp. CA-210063]
MVPLRRAIPVDRHGRADAAAAVGPPHLLLTAAVAPLATAAVVHAWRRLTKV